MHRLDKLTSGLMVVARNEAAQLNLVRQLQEHAVAREYWAIVAGIAPEAGLSTARSGAIRVIPRSLSAAAGPAAAPQKPTVGSWTLPTLRAVP